MDYLFPFVLEHETRTTMLMLDYSAESNVSGLGTSPVLRLFMSRYQVLDGGNMVIVDGMLGIKRDIDYLGGCTAVIYT